MIYAFHERPQFNYAVREIGLPGRHPKFIQSRNFKHFNEENFLTDLENASWPDTKKRYGNE